MADSITEIFNVFKRCNKYIDETEPWVLAKAEANNDRLSTVMYNLACGIMTGASLLEHFMPETSAKIAAELGSSLRAFDTLGEFGGIAENTKVSEAPETLFARLDAEEVIKRADALYESRKQPVSEEAKEETEVQGIHVELKDQIEYDDFAKCQFVVGEIIKCEEVPKSKKLLCSQVKIGDSVKQILSGIKQWYKPDEMVGKKVMVLLNLKPAKMAGLDSEGMLLCAEDAEGNVVLMTPEKDVESGSEIG